MATEMDWDSDLDEQSAAGSKENDFTLLPDGEYDFEVKKLEKDRYVASPTSKIPSCPKAVVHLLVTAPDGKRNYFRENLYLYDGNRWKLLQFFVCLGLRKHGDGKTNMPWNKVEGCTGRAKLGHRDYNGNTYNQVVRWLDPPKFEAGGDGQAASDQDPYDGDF